MKLIYRREFWGGVGRSFYWNVLFVLLLGYIAIMWFEPAIFAVWFVGILQFLYLGPIILREFKAGRKDRAKGMLFTSGLLLLGTVLALLSGVGIMLLLMFSGIRC